MVTAATIEIVDHVLKTTRSVRRNLDLEREVPVAEIHGAIAAAIQAPVSLAGENWRFLVVTDAALKQRIADHYREILEALLVSRGEVMKPTHQALIDNLPRMPVLVFVYALGEPADSAAGQLAFYGSILPAAWSLMLSLRARGLGTTWTTLLSARAQQIADILGVPDGVTQTVMLPVAYTRNAVLKEASRADVDAVTFWNQWGRTL